MSPLPSGVGDDDDPSGLDEGRNHLAEAVGRFVPQSLARRALSVSVDTARSQFAVGDPVPFTVTIRNRLPVPIRVHTPRRRLWTWYVDGEREASDERLYESDQPGVLVFRGREAKSVRHVWSGRFERTGERRRWVDPDPGVYELSAAVALDGDCPSDAVKIEFVSR